MTTYGYCRISTAQQNIERQVRNIKSAYPTATIVQEVYTGTTTARPKWDALRKKLRAGDTVVFDSVSRMSRNASEGTDLYEALYNEGVNLCFLKEPHINTDTYKTALSKSVPMTGTAIDCILKGINEYIMVLAKEQITIAFDQAEKEVQDLRQRTSEGIKTARLNGKQIGAVEGKKLTTQKSIEAKQIIKKHCKTFGGTLSDSETQTLCGIARNSYYKYKRELLEELNK